MEFSCAGKLLFGKNTHRAKSAPRIVLAGLLLREKRVASVECQFVHLRPIYIDSESDGDNENLPLAFMQGNRLDHTIFLCNVFRRIVDRSSNCCEING